MFWAKRRVSGKASRQNEPSTFKDLKDGRKADVTQAPSTTGRACGGGPVGGRAAGLFWVFCSGAGVRLDEVTGSACRGQRGEDSDPYLDWRPTLKGTEKKQPGKWKRKRMWGRKMRALKTRRVIKWQTVNGEREGRTENADCV